MKKIVSILLVIIIMCLAAGCENVEYIDATSTETGSQDIYEQLESQLPEIEKDENGEVKQQKFTVATSEVSVFYNEESVSGALNKAVEQRNIFLMDKYGAEIEVKKVSGTGLTSELKASLESGIEFCDMICVSATTTTKLYTAGLLGDMNTLPNFDPNNAYFDQRNATELATNSTFYILPDPTAQIYDELHVLFFNRNLINAAGADPESLVMQGKWTWDAFHETAKAAAPKVYEKATSDIYKDTFGLGAYYGETTYPFAIWVSTGEKLIGNTYKNPVELALTPDYITEVCQNLVKKYNTRGKYPLDGNDAMEAFEKEGRLAFFSNKLSYMYALRDGTSKGSEYGVLPMPKYSEEQTQYYSLVSNEARVFSVPKTIESATQERKAFVSAVIQATCAAGRTTVRDAYVAHFIGQYLNNNTETVVLKTIIDSATFDFSQVYGSTISQVSGPTLSAVSDFIGFGSNIGGSIGRTKSTFNKYCQEKFQ